MAGLNFGTVLDTGKDNLTNVDWADTAEGTGYVYWEGWSVETSTGNTYNLSTSSEIVNLYTSSTDKGNNDSTTTTITNLPATITKIEDLDFDASIYQLPKLVKGTAIIKLSYSVICTSGTFDEIYLIAKLRKWDGSSETEIASVQSPTETSIVFGGDASRSVNLLLPVVISAINKFAVGDNLRLTVEIWGKDAAGGTSDGSVTLNHNPSGSRLTIGLPMRIEEQS